MRISLGFATVAACLATLCTIGLIVLAGSQSAMAGKTVRDHRGTSQNNVAPISGTRGGDIGWGNYGNGKGGGATVRDHRKPPCLPAVPGTEGSLVDLSNCR